MPERLDEPNRDYSVRNWQSVRTILEGLILLGVIWIGNNSIESSKNNVELKVEITAMNEQFRVFNAQLAEFPAMSRSLAKIEVKLEEHERRISNVEQARLHQ